MGRIVSRVQLAEELGFDGVWGFDHFQPMYGEGPGETFDGMTTLAGLAGVTSRIRLGLLVAGVTYRHPSVFAAQALTIDHASHGRLELSLGAAWFDKEHIELGIPFPSRSERFDLLEDALEIVTRLFTGEVVSYDGRVVSLHDARLRPLPVQQPHPPIWIGGSGPRRTLPLAARFADVWHTWGTPSSLRDVNARLDELAEQAGRDPASIVRASSLSLDDLDTARKQVGEWQDAGYGYLVCEWPAAGRNQVEGFARAVVAEFTESSAGSTTATGVAGELTAPGSRSGGAVSRNRLRLCAARDASSWRYRTALRAGRRAERGRDGGSGGRSVLVAIPAEQPFDRVVVRHQHEICDSVIHSSNDSSHTSRYVHILWICTGSGSRFHSRTFVAKPVLQQEHVARLHDDAVRRHDLLKCVPVDSTQVVAEVVGQVDEDTAPLHLPRRPCAPCRGGAEGEVPAPVPRCVGLRPDQVDPGAVPVVIDGLLVPVAVGTGTRRPTWASESHCVVLRREGHHVVGPHVDVTRVPVVPHLAQCGRCRTCRDCMVYFLGRQREPAGGAAGSRRLPPE